MTTTPKTIQLPNSQKNVIPTYAIRFTYPFDNIDSTYVNTQTPFHLQDQAIDPEKFNSFWKQIYTDAQNFSKLKSSKKIPKCASITAYLLFLAGVIFLIVGCIPIWKGQDNNMNMSFIIIAGVLIALSVLEKITMTCVVKRYREGSLFKQYEKIVLKAVSDNFAEYFSKGLHWRGGAFGFKCIEFWYVFDEEKAEESPRRGTTITNSSVLQTETGNLLLPKNKLEEPSTALSDSASDFRNLLTQFSPLMPSPSPLMQKRAELARKAKNKKQSATPANGQSLDESHNSLFINSYRGLAESESKMDSSRKTPVVHHRASLMSEEMQSPGNTEYSLDSPDIKSKGNLLEAPSSGYKRPGEIAIKSKLGVSSSDMDNSLSSPSLNDSNSPVHAPIKLNKNGALPPLKEELKVKYKQNKRYSGSTVGESLNLENSTSGVGSGGSTEIDPIFNSLTDNSVQKKEETIIKLGKAGPIELNWGPESSSNTQINTINASVVNAISAETPENNQELPKIVIDSTPIRPHMRRPANRKSMLKQQQIPSPLREIPQVDEEESEIEQTPKGFDSTIEQRRKRMENNAHAIMSIEPIAFSPHGLKVVEIEDYEADL